MTLNYSNEGIFISYRRNPDAWVSRMIYDSLVGQGYDVFLDTEAIEAGRFENVILNEIGARTHFIVLVSESWAESVVDPASWCFRELERALDLKKNVIPVLINGATYGLSIFNNRVLSELPKLNSLVLHPEYFEGGMQRLQKQLLKQPTLQELAILTAEEHFQRGQELFAGGQYKDAIREFDAGAQLNPIMPELFNNRAIAKYATGDLEGALADLDRAIAIEPNGHEAHTNKGDILQEMGRLREALDSYTRARGRIPRRFQLE
jgi:tetratricopeptide (TPR) repeat protein